MTNGPQVRARPGPRLRCWPIPNLVALSREFSYADPDERFELLIDIFVDGLARLAEQG